MNQQDYGRRRPRLLWLLLSLACIYGAYRVFSAAWGPSAARTSGEVKVYPEYASALRVLSEVPDTVPTPAPAEETEPAAGTRGNNSDNNPATGTVLERYYGEQSSTMMLQNRTDKDACVMMVHASDGQEALLVFVRSMEDCTVKVPSGTYVIYALVGNEWMGDAKVFRGSDERMLLAPSCGISWGDTVSFTIESSMIPAETYIGG